MPITPITRDPLPYVRPAYEPDTRTLRELMAMAGQSRAQQIGRGGQSRAEGLMTLGQILSQGLAGIRQDREARALAEQQAIEKREAANKPVAVGGRLIRPMSGEIVYEPPPEPQRPFEVGGNLVDPTGKVLYEGPQKPSDGFSLSPGQRRFDMSGKEIASVPSEEPRESNVTRDQLAWLAENGKDDTTRQAAARALKRIESLNPRPQPQTRYMPRDVMANGKPVTANYDSATGKYFDVNTGQPLSGVSAAPTADMRNKDAAKAPAARAIDAVRQLGSSIFTKVGPSQRLTAARRGVEAVFGNDPEFRTYQDSRMALAGTLAVEQQGSRVSDADVRALWLPMVPDAYRDTEDSYKLKWELIDAMRGVEPTAPPPSKPPQDGTGPRVGERRTINGQLGEWDGKGWKAVRPQ